MKSKRLFLGVSLLLALGLVACGGGNKESEGEKSNESAPTSQESAPSSSKSSKSKESKSSTEPEPDPVDAELFNEENKTWLEEHFDKLYYWNDQNWCGSQTNMTRAQLDKNGVYHYAWKTEEGSGQCDYSIQFFYNIKECVAGERYVVMFDLVASGAVEGTDFTLVYADEGTQHPGLKAGLNKIRYAETHTPRPESSTDYYGATISFHFSAEVAREKEFSIEVSKIRVYPEAEAPVEVVPPEIPEDHVHNLEAVAHEKGEGEVTEEIKKCANDPYHEISFSAIDSAAQLSVSGDKKSRSVKLSKQGEDASTIEYKFYSPVALKGRFWVDITGNTTNHWDRETGSGQQALWYTYVDSTTGIVDYKYLFELNGEKVDFDEQTYNVNGTEIPFKELVYSDFGTLSSANGESTIAVPLPEIQIEAGVNTIKFTRLTGYAVNFHKFTFKGIGNGEFVPGEAQPGEEVTTLPALNVVLYKKFVSDDNAAALKTAFEAYLTEQKVAITSLVWNVGCEGTVSDLNTYVSDYNTANAEAKFDVILGGKAFANCDYLNGNYSVVMDGENYKEMTIADKTDRRVWVLNETPNFAAAKLLVKSLLNFDLPDPEPAVEPLPANGIALKVGEQVKFEAENAVPTAWKNSGWGSNDTFVADDAEANASGGKFVTPSTGTYSADRKFEIVIDAPSDGTVSMKVAYCRGGKNSKTATIDYSYVYQYRLDGESGKFTCVTAEHTDSHVASWDWVEIEFTFTVTAGRHTIAGCLDAGNANTNAGCPCIDYYLFTLAAPAVA